MLKTDISSGEFVEDIVVNLLGKPISSKEYDKPKIGGSRNLFRLCVERNKGVGDTCAFALANLITQETKFDESKKSLVFDYIKQFLTPKEQEYMNRNPDDVKIIVGFAAQKFNKHNKVPDINKLHYRSPKSLRAVSLNELFDMGWTIEDYTNWIVKVWKELIPGMPDEHIGDIGDWRKIMVEHPETRKALLNSDNEMIGYWEFDPLFDKKFELAKNGELSEGDMSLDDIPFMFEGTYNIYFENICIINKHKNSLAKSVALRKMLNSIIYTLEDLALNKVYINEICTWAYTESGIALCKSLGLKHHKKHDEMGEVYCGTIHDLLNNSICNDFTLIKEQYGII